MSTDGTTPLSDLAWLEITEAGAAPERTVSGDPGVLEGHLPFPAEKRKVETADLDGRSPGKRPLRSRLLGEVLWKSLPAPLPPKPLKKLGQKPPNLRKIGSKWLCWVSSTRVREQTW